MSSLDTTLSKSLRSFSNFDEESWRGLARKELSSKADEKIFFWKYDPYMQLRAYYGLADRPVKAAHHAQQLQAGDTTTDRTQRWQSLFYLSRLQKKNAAAYAKLLSTKPLSYCDGILYDMGNQPEKAPTDVLKNLQSHKRPIFYRVQADSAAAKETFSRLLKERVLPPFTALWWARPTSTPILSTPTSSLDNTALQAAGAPPTLQIAHLLSALSAYLRSSLQASKPLQQALSDILITQAAEPDYYHEVAKLRALRLCMAKVATAFGEKRPCAARFRILATTSPWQQSCLEPSMDLLRSTSQALSLAVGGATQLLILPSAMGLGAVNEARLALNLAQLLRHEAEVERVVDPAAGAYFFEHLTDALARRAWREFQEIEAAGGLQTPSVADQLLAKCEEHRSQQQQALDSGKQRRIGVHAYVQAASLSAEATASDLYLHAYPSVVAPYEKVRRDMDTFFQDRPKPKLHMCSLEKGSSVAQLQRHLQDIFAALGFVCPEEFASVDEPFPSSPFLLVCTSPQQWTPQGTAVFSRLFSQASTLQEIRFCLLGGWQKALPAELPARAGLHYFSFPQPSVLESYQRLQNCLYDAFS